MRRAYPVPRRDAESNWGNLICSGPWRLSSIRDQNVHLFSFLFQPDLESLERVRKLSFLAL